MATKSSATHNWLRLPAQTDGPLGWAQLDGESVVAQGEVDSPTDLPDSFFETPVTAVAPAQVANVLLAEIPARSRAQLLAAVPFAIEDRVAQDIETLHCVPGEQQDKTVTIAAVDQFWLEQVLERLDAHRLTLRNVWVENAWLPATQPMVWQLPAYAIYGDDQGNRSRLAPDDLSWLIPADVQVDVFATADVTWSLPDTLAVGQRKGFASVWVLWAHCAAHRSGVDLLQGAFARANPGQNARPWWISVGVAAGVALAMYTGLQWANLMRLQSQITQLRNQQIQLFEETFPDLSHGGNPVARMRSQVNARLSGFGAADSFLGLLRSAGLHIAKNPRVQIQSFDYRDRTLVLRLTAESVADFDALAAALQQENGLRAQLGSSTNTGSGYEGTMQIRMAGRS